MRIRRFSLRWWVAATSTIAVVLLFGYLALKRYEDNIRSRIVVRETSATVTGKEHVRFDESNPWYTTDQGNRIDVRPGDEQWRVYYEINNFDRLDESVRVRLLRSEKERASVGKSRFWIESKEWCERIEAGDQITVRYQWHGGDDIEIVGVENPKYKIPQ